MKTYFRPGYTIVNYEYDQPSSGGQVIVTPGDPAHSYVDSAGNTYMYMDGMEGEGWYCFTPDGKIEFIGPTLDVSGMIEQ